MGTKERRLSGTVIGHTVKFLPKRVVHRGEGITVTQDKRLAALVTIQVDDRKTFTVPSKETEVILEDQEPTTEAMAAVYDMLTARHPFGKVRAFTEYITVKTKNGKKSSSRKYELLQE